MESNLFLGDTLEILRTLSSESVNCCVTSPPYFGLRDYGMNGQLGLEKTPEEFVEKLVEVFREVKRVLRKDGTLWLNLGDSYNGSGGAGGDYNKGGLKEGQPKYPARRVAGSKAKDLIGIPWMVAFALRKDGWWLRQDIIWTKKNPMPEPVKDRCVKAHEYIFLLSPSRQYFFNARVNGHQQKSVWNIPVRGFRGVHFATFPIELPLRCIEAGCPENGIVLDPFMGSGTSGVAAIRLKRSFVGIELNGEYLDIARGRIDQEIAQPHLFT